MPDAFRCSFEADASAELMKISGPPSARTHLWHFRTLSVKPKVTEVQENDQKCEQLQVATIFHNVKVAGPKRGGLQCRVLQKVLRICQPRPCR